MLPGIGTTRTATPRRILASVAGLLYLPGGKTIDGSKSRDPGNVGDEAVLVAGTLMGKITTSGKYAPSIIGVLQSAAASGATSFTVTPAQAAEIVRRIGSTGSLTLIGPPSAAGTVAVLSATYTAVNTTTGVVTCAALSAALIAGAHVCSTDGTANPVTLITDEYGIKVTDDDGVSIDEQFPKFIVSGMIDTAQIRNCPTDTSLLAWVKAKLRANGYGFTFNDDF